MRSFHWRIVAILVAVFAFAPAASAQTITVPLKEKAGALFVQVEVDGRKCNFILDTGARMTIVDIRSLVVTKQMEVRQAQADDGRVGTRGEAVATTIELHLGTRIWTERRVAAMNLQDLDARYGMHVDGLLGMDVLKTFSRITLDLKRNVLELET
jgi:predicted aspartyl protease